MSALAAGRAPHPDDGQAAESVVRLLDAEPEIAAGLAGDDLALAYRHLVLPGLRIPAGPWTPQFGPSTAISLLVLDGYLVRDGGDGEMPDVQLVGAGDFIDVRLLAESPDEWRALTSAHVAVLDARILIGVRRWPQLTLGLTRRLFDGHRDQCRVAAIRALPRVDERIMAYLSHAASRWGRVTRDGVALTLPATHELLGRLVGARRPTVSLALASLAGQGRLARLDDGRWLLPRPDGEAPVTSGPRVGPQRARGRGGAAGGEASGMSLAGGAAHEPGTSA